MALSRVSPLRAAHMRQEVLDVNRRGEFSELQRRLKALGFMGGEGGWQPGPEFAGARGAYEALAGEPAVGDISGMGDLNAAEMAAFIEQQEAINRELGTAEGELRDVAGRMGGGGSEMAEMMRQLKTGAMGARVKARRGALTTAQGSREQAKQRRQYGLQAGGAGLAGLAGQRQGMQRFGAEQTLQRLQMLTGGGMGGMYQAPSAGVRDTSYRSVGGIFDPNRYGTSGYTSDVEKAALRKAYIPPTQRGNIQYIPPIQRGSWL